MYLNAATHKCYLIKNVHSKLLVVTFFIVALKVLAILVHAN